MKDADHLRAPLLGPGGATATTAAPRSDNDGRANDLRLDQYYTLESVAAHCYDILQDHIDPGSFLMVEPSAGDGAFYRLLPPGSLGYDLDPKCPGVVKADFLTVEIGGRGEIGGGREIAIVGNPPFGRSSSLAVRFFNHAARQANLVAMILPRTFRKASIQNRLDPAFHLLREEDVQRDAFLFRGSPYNVPTTFQIWQRGRRQRAMRRTETRHPDFEFVTPDRADFAIQRVGARAGRIHREFGMSPSSHYFVRGPVEAIMRRLDLAGAARNVAGNPSLAKSEIVALYRKHAARRA